MKHGAKEWASYDYNHKVMHHTKRAEEFSKLFKNPVRSTHIHISSKYMDRYLAEFTYRTNDLQMENAMFDLLISALRLRGG